MITLLLTLFCSFSFWGYGLSCIFSKHMKAEFERYGLARFRLITGLLQVAAAAGLLIGMKLPAVGIFSATGLAAQMALGLGVRLRIGDSWILCLPATAYMIICGYLATQLM
jgi:hypothetical protein